MIHDDELWRQAIAAYQRIQGLTKDEQQQQLEEMELSPAVLEKVTKLLQKMEDNQSNLDLDSQQIFAKAANETAVNNLIGKTIGSYKILGLIAKGGMSTIFKAINTQAKINKPVALKLLSPYVFSDKAVELFKREQLILSQLQHPNIVSFHHSGKTEDGTHYLIMENVEGAQNIKDFCQQKQLSTKQIIGYVIKLGKILAYAHSNLIIHRDIKPANVLIDQHGNIKVIDFGIAQIAANEQGTSTQVFTKDSASPEQILGKPVNTQTDVFSLGAILLELLVKKRPLPDINIASYDPLNDTKHVNQLLKQSNLDKDLQNIIRKAMHIDVAQRYSAMGAFVSDMENWRQNKPISATSDSHWYKFKKFVVRNPLSVGFASLLFVALFIGLLLVNSYAQQAQNEADKANETLALITEIFNQTDSWTPPNPDRTLRETLESFSENKLPELDLDPEVLARIHDTFGTIYGNFGLYNRSEQHYQIALEQYSDSDKNTLLPALKLQNDLGTMKRLLGDHQTAISLLSHALAQLRLHHPKELKLELDMMINLMDSFYPDQYDLPLAQQSEQRMLEVLSVIQSDNPLVAGDAYSSLAIKQQHQSQKNMQQAGEYLQQAIRQLDDPKYHHSFEFINVNRTLAILKYRENKLEESGAILADLINKLKQTETDQMMLIRTYGDYASIMFIKGDYALSMQILDEAVASAEALRSDELLYVPLSKRAMYHIRLNDFEAGIKDQLHLLELTFKARQDQLHSSLFNLALMFYAINYTETAQLLASTAINYAAAELKDSASTVEFFHLSAGVAEWFAGSEETATDHWHHANQFGLDKNKDYRHLLGLLLQDYDKTDSTSPKNNTLIPALSFLLSVDPNGISKDVVTEYCSLPEDFITNKNFAVKQLYLQKCIGLINELSLPAQDELIEQQQQIIMGKDKAQLTPEKLWKQQVDEILKAL